MYTEDIYHDTDIIMYERAGKSKKKKESMKTLNLSFRGTVN